MNTLRILYHLARADFHERIRRYSVLVTLAVTVWAAYIFVPANNSSYTTLTMNGHRGVYNSAWIGTQVAMLTTLFLMLFGFYLVKNTIERDRRTGVGQIIATTPLSRSAYMLGKAASNYAVLLMMVIVIVGVSAVMQLVRGEDMAIHPWDLISPFALMSVPMLAVIAAVAVFFEAVPFLRGGLGNLIFFFGSIGALSSQALEKGDLLGMATALTGMKHACHAAFPAEDTLHTAMNLGINIPGDGTHVMLTTFPWQGVSWTADLVAARLELFAVAFVITLAAALSFDRFDTARAGQDHDKPPGRMRRWSEQAESALFGSTDAIGTMAPAKNHVHLTPLGGNRSQSRFVETLRAELRLSLKGQSWWWLLGTLALIIIGMSVPLKGGREIVLPIAWIWPTLIWSSLGVREVRHATNQIVFSAAHPLRRQLPASWLAGVLIALVIGGGVGLRLILAGDWLGTFAFVAGAAFIPSLALALGTWSGVSRLFEIVYAFWWYAGPLNHAPGMDFTGGRNGGGTFAAAFGYAAVAVILFSLATLGRRRQMYF